MRQNRLKVIFLSLALIITASLVYWFAPMVLAGNVDTGLNYADATGLASSDPRMIVAKIIRIILGFLGIIAIGLIMYAGFIWMTASGEEEKIEKAKKIMISAAIGLVIVVSSFGIASYIISRLGDAVGGGSSGGSCNPACSSGQYCCNGSCQTTPCNNIGGGNDVFLVSGTTPAHQSVGVIRNAVIRFRFNNGVRESSVSGASFTVVSGGAGIDGQRVVNGSYIEFTPAANCEAPNEGLKCLPKNSVITVEAKNTSSGIISVDGKELTCGGTSRCLLNFTTGEIVDTEAPNINITSQQVCANANNVLSASSTDNYGVAKIDFYVADSLVGSSINNSNPFVGSPYNAETPWDSNGFTVGQSVTLKATAYDLDTNSKSADKTIRLSAAHCCNNIKDGDETGIDCGGSCLACIGQDCGSSGLPNQCNDDLCQSGFCGLSGNPQSCLCDAQPIIEWVSPAGGFCSNNVNKFCRYETQVQDCGPDIACNLGTPNGATGNFITIAGSGFGISRGKVFIAGVEAKLADDANSGNSLCSNSVWKDDQIIAVVPAGANDGKISIETANKAKDDTSNNYGPLIHDFRKNTIDRPGICAISPNKAKKDVVVNYAGIKLNTAEAYYGSLSVNAKALVSTFTDSKSGTAMVPNITSGDTTTFVLKAGVESNFVPFIKDNEPYEGPMISSIEPLTGPVGQYVTIRGSGFGSSRSTSKVFFGAAASGIEADYAFPDVCADSVWSNNQIVVKAPSGLTVNSNYKITIQRSGYDDADSKDQQFKATAGTPDPGLCRVQPALGQANSEVILWGEYFKDQDTNSTVRFHDNKNQQGDFITFWDTDEASSGDPKPWKVITTVPQTATTGPVRLLAGSPTQQSNAFNFTVDKCVKDSDCGSEAGATCCAAGLPEAGKCKSNPSECYGSVANSVYQWRFSTGNEAECAIDQHRCGTVCCYGLCDDPVTPTKCMNCLPNQNECGDGSCCGLSCEVPVGGGKSFCPDPPSCSGYSQNQCSEGFYCPNSPGLCSPYPGNGNPIEVGDCGDDNCLNQPGCKGNEENNCYYDLTFNRCLQKNTNACKKPQLLDSNKEVIKKDNNEPIEGECKLFQNNPHWHINSKVTCPAGWIKGTGGVDVCVDKNDLNGPCSYCGGNPFVCYAPSGKEGKCVSGGAICPNGSACDVASGKCKKPDTGKCDCCCDKNNANADCCLGLTCEGSCGSSASNLGICSGCVVEGQPIDELCNCFGSIGKFCDNSTNPKGVCNDCAAITDPAECSEHPDCCVNAKNGNKCDSVVDGGSRFQENGAGLFFCAYYSCTNDYPNSCNPLATKNGVYNKFNTCNVSCPTAAVKCSTLDQCANPECPNDMRCDLKTCECKTDTPTVGEPCKDPLTQACTGACSTGYQCLLPSVYNGGNGIDSCLCCCKPTSKPGDIDSCRLINSNLSCLPDKEPCSSETKERGLCCGCTRDDQCGDVATVGCSPTDQCCRTRPTVESYVPAINATNICRNTSIEAVFNQKMDKASFSDNVLLIGDYKEQFCDGNIVSKSYDNKKGLAAVIFSFKRLVVKLFPSLVNKPAFAEFSNFCYINGSAVAYDVGDNKTKVTYRLTKPLESNIKYYVIVQGDPALVGTNNNPYYNAKVNNFYKVGLAGYSKALDQFNNIIDEFNHTSFKNAEIWSFTTGKDICKLNKISINPSFTLFQRSGQEASLIASAVDNKGKVIQGIPGVYNWSWSWKSDDEEIATVTQSGVIDEGFKAMAKSGNKKDVQTYARAKATVTIDTVNAPSTTGQSVEGSAALRVFLCENPWPVYYSDPPFPPGYTWPWQDSTSGIEFYYCRDKSGVGTIDDLPAITNPPVIKDGGRKICMFGSNVGRTCTSDTGCGNLAGSCLSEVLKEFFFFRESEPGIPNIQGVVDPVGGKVTLTWPATVNASKYKVYYGLNQGQYVFTAEVPASGNQISKTIGDLVNGLDYYFAVTALSNKNQESIYSNELKLSPADTTPPAAPDLRVEAGDKKLSLFWPAVPDAYSYVAYIGLASKNYALAVSVRNTPLPGKPNHVFFSNGAGSLINGVDYYLSVKSVDLYGNISPYSNEVVKKPGTGIGIGD